MKIESSKKPSTKQLQFKYGTIVTGKDFCGRKDLIKQLTEHIKSAQKCVIFGERRIGKSSLVYETMLRLQSSHYLISVDLMEVKSLDDLCRRMLRSIMSVKWNAGIIQKIIGFISALRPQIGIDSMTGLPTLTIDQRHQLNEETLENIFRILKETSRKKNIVVFFDEFQDVLNIDDSKGVLAALRGKIQLQETISFIFAGSIRDDIVTIFTDAESPFFKSAIPMQIDSISKAEFQTFIENSFASGMRSLENGIMDKIFIIASSITGDIQEMCEALWSVSEPGDLISEKHFNEAIKLIFSREQGVYQIILNRLTAFQLKILTAIALNGGKNLYSNEFMGKAGLSNASSVRKAVSRLVEFKVIYDYQNEYKFINPFFAFWLKSKI